MSSSNTFSTNMMFQSLTDDLNATLATADELSREFSSLLQDISSTSTDSSTAERSSAKPQIPPIFTQTGTTAGPTRDAGGSVMNRGTMSFPQTTSPVRLSEPSTHSSDSYFTSDRNHLTSPSSQAYQYAPFQPRNARSDPVRSPNHSPHTQRRVVPNPARSHERNVSGTFTFSELSPAYKYEQQSGSSKLQIPANQVTAQDSINSGRRSPRLDRAPSPGPFSHLAAGTHPHSFAPFKTTDENVSRQSSNAAKWNETDLDVSYERKPHHTYDKNEWIRPSVPNSNWRESNLDSPTVSRKDPLPRHLPSGDGSLARNTRITVPPELVSPTQAPLISQPIISRVSIPPASAMLRPRRPIPLSVIMRLQNPYYTAASRYPLGTEGERDLSMPRQPMALPREFLYHFQPVHQEQRPPVYYAEAPKSMYADPMKTNSLTRLAVLPEIPTTPAEQSKEPKVEASTTSDDPEEELAPRPLSPTRLQPVVAPEVPVAPDMDVLLQIRSEFPRALKKRGSVNHSHAMKATSLLQPNQYKQIIKKMFRRKGPQIKGETGSDDEELDEEEISPTIPCPTSPITNTANTAHYKSILRKPKGGSGVKGPHARLSPLVLLLDGALVGELDTVQRAMQEMSDPSQPNDEGITALHNAICGGHHKVVEFLVRIGANVSAPDSHGWTPLHCAASCNDRALCEYLVRNGAAVMAVTESDGATAAQKCDPYAVGYEECESFLRGVEEALGVDNSGVLYALWSYPAQTHDELGFKEGEMVTILQKPEGTDWWWASLCGREGLVPNNYFGLFPKVRPKSLC